VSWTYVASCRNKPTKVCRAAFFAAVACVPPCDIAVMASSNAVCAAVKIRNADGGCGECGVAGESGDYRACEFVQVRIGQLGEA
jgi:hypothetical protein